VLFETPDRSLQRQAIRPTHSVSKRCRLRCPRSRLCTAVCRAQSIDLRCESGTIWTDVPKKVAPAMVSPGQRSRELN